MTSHNEFEEANASLAQTLDHLGANQLLLNEMGKMANVGGWQLDIKTGKQLWTEEIYRIHELDLDYQPTGDKGIAFYAPSARPVIEQAVRRAIDFGESYDLELEFITAKGNHRWVHTMGKADLEHGRLFGTFQDITTIKQADEELREKNAALDRSVAQLRKLAMELTQAEESERKRLATLLHDHIQQYIVAATMKISLLDCHAPMEENTKIIQETLSLLGTALDASRSLTTTLYPPVLLNAGLAPALRWLAEWMKDKHGLTVEVTGDDPDKVPPPLCILLFQAVRELLFNITKHAGVCMASVAMDQPNTTSLRIIVTDHGRGFPKAVLDAPFPARGIGLFHLRERLAYVGITA